MSTCDVVVVDTKKINKDMMYYDGISALVRAMRPNNPNASGRTLVSEPRGKLCVLLVDDELVSMLRVFKDKNLFGDDVVEYINLVITLPEERRKG